MQRMILENIAQFACNLKGKLQTSSLTSHRLLSDSIRNIQDAKTSCQLFLNTNTGKYYIVPRVWCTVNAKCKPQAPHSSQRARLYSILGEKFRVNLSFWTSAIPSHSASTYTQVLRKRNSELQQLARHHRDTHSLRKPWVATTSAISLHVNSLAKASKHPKLYKHELTDMRNKLHTIRPEWQAPTSAWTWKAQALPPRRWWILSQAAAQCTIFADVNITLTTQHK
jgi:hypothetical protein